MIIGRFEPLSRKKITKISDFRNSDAVTSRRLLWVPGTSGELTSAWGIVKTRKTRYRRLFFLGWSTFFSCLSGWWASVTSREVLVWCTFWTTRDKTRKTSSLLGTSPDLTSHQNKLVIHQEYFDLFSETLIASISRTTCAILMVRHALLAH